MSKDKGSNPPPKPNPPETEKKRHFTQIAPDGSPLTPEPPKNFPVEIPKNPPIVRDEKGRFVKGHPQGGPGKMKGFPQIPATLRKILNEEIDTKYGKRKRFELLMRKVVEKAWKGDAWAIQFIADRLEGKARERISIETEGLTFEELRAMSKTEREEIRLHLTRAHSGKP